MSEEVVPSQSGKTFLEECHSACASLGPRVAVAVVGGADMHVGGQPQSDVGGTLWLAQAGTQPMTVKLRNTADRRLLPLVVLPACFINRKLPTTYSPRHTIRTEHRAIFLLLGSLCGEKHSGVSAEPCESRR